MAESLYEKVYAAQQANISGKRRVGYTVGAYAGVLDALKKAEMVVVEEQIGGSVYGAEVSSTNVDVVVNGFYQNGQKQAEVTYNNYMSFLVDVKNSDGSICREVVGVPSNISDHDGISIMGSSNIQYPTAKYTKEANDACKTGVGSFGGFVNLAVIQLNFIAGNLTGIIRRRTPGECAFILIGHSRSIKRGDFGWRSGIFDGQIDFFSRTLIAGVINSHDCHRNFAHRKSGQRDRI